MALNYQVLVKLVPEQGRSGDSVTMEARFTGIEGEIAQVQAVEANHYVSGRLLKREEGIYALTMQVPYGAPSGIYTVNLHAVDAEGNRGPRASARFQVL